MVWLVVSNMFYFPYDIYGIILANQMVMLPRSFLEMVIPFFHGLLLEMESWTAAQAGHEQMEPVLDREDTYAFRMHFANWP